MSKLKVKTKKVIDCSDWDALVEETYGRTYCFQQQNGCQDRGNFRLTIPSEYTEDEYMHDSIEEEINGDEMGVKFKVWLERDPKEWNGKKDDERFVGLFWERNFYPDIHTIANDLYAKGLIEAGDYTIEIDW